MIRIVPKPTDTPDDNSTGAVIRELERAGASYSLLDLDRIDPLASDLSGDVIWVCGMKQDIHQFECLDILSIENDVVNPPDAIATCASKVKTTALLLRAGIPSPETLFTASLDLAADFFARHGRVVSKPVYGYDGIDVRLVDSLADLGAPPYYLQEYVPNDRDFRVFVIEGKGVGAICRQSPHLTHNIHQGGTGTPVEVDPLMQEIAGGAAGAVGAHYCGVDLLPQNGSYTAIEVNGTPNWHCMSAPIPRLMAEYLLEKERESRR
ncbi:ATP-grasp domain-containing protein [Methanofollis fontis]|uniref:RimK family alpha-L-glutamate ligase n=1 Tax=Methanofollis fontis TaxID=2052832 RepID=A0A483CNX2_9EURY|nr:ATP-grasp domain-containing protein [Methanofollis fontis]TAJ44762.1 RimK family alpha-L-glutamate ligase [Methanofollis fontis]